MYPSSAPRVQLNSPCHAKSGVAILACIYDGRNHLLSEVLRFSFRFTAIPKKTEMVWAAAADDSGRAARAEAYVR